MAGSTWQFVRYREDAASESGYATVRCGTHGARNSVEDEHGKKIQGMYLLKMMIYEVINFLRLRNREDIGQCRRFLLNLYELSAIAPNPLKSVWFE